MAADDLSESLRKWLAALRCVAYHATEKDSRMPDGRHHGSLDRRNDVGAHWPYSSKRLHDDARRLAASAVGGAIKLGRLVQQPCEKCADPDSEAHHDDYDKPLEVRWLCRSCHRTHHKGRPVVAAKHDKYQRRSIDAAMPQILAITKALRDDMDAQDLTQRELAGLAGVTQPVVVAWFAGGFKTLSSLIYAAKALGGELNLQYVPRRAKQSRVA